MVLLDHACAIKQKESRYEFEQYVIRKQVRDGQITLSHMYTHYTHTHVHRHVDHCIWMKILQKAGEGLNR